MYIQALATAALSIVTVDLLDPTVVSSRLAVCEGDDRGLRTCNQDATHRVCAKIKNDHGFFKATGQAAFDWSDRIGETWVYNMLTSRSALSSPRSLHSPSLPPSLVRAARAHQRRLVHLQMGHCEVDRKRRLRCGPHYLRCNRCLRSQIVVHRLQPRPPDRAQMRCDEMCRRVGCMRVESAAARMRLAVSRSRAPGRRPSRVGTALESKLV